LYWKIHRNSNSINISICICTAGYRWIWVFRFRLVDQNLLIIQDFDLHFDDHSESLIFHGTGCTWFYFSVGPTGQLRAAQATFLNLKYLSEILGSTEMVPSWTSSKQNDVHLKQICTEDKTGSKRLKIGRFQTFLWPQWRSSNVSVLFQRILLENLMRPSYLELRV